MASEERPWEYLLTEEDITTILEGSDRAELAERNGSEEEEPNVDFWVSCLISATRLLVTARLRARVEASHRAELTRLTAEVERYRDLLRRWYEDVGMREVDRMTYPGWRELDTETRTALTTGEQNADT